MSAASTSGEAIESRMNIAQLKRENVRLTLEKLTSQSNSLLLLTFQWKDLEDHFDSIQSSLREMMEEVELKSQQTEWKQKYTKQKMKEIEARGKQLQEEMKMVEDRRKEVDVTYELVEKCYRVVKGKEEVLDEKLRWVEEKELELAEKLKEADEKTKLLDSKERKIRRHTKKLEKMEEELCSSRQQAKRRKEELEGREKKLGLMDREVMERIEEVELRENEFEEEMGELERRENELGERFKELEMKEERFHSIMERMETEPLDNLGDDDWLNDPSYADIRLNVTMNGRALQSFLNGRVNDHEKMREEVIDGLQLSKDPAKLVLDAMEGFYPENLEDGNVGSDPSIVRKSCILLLEQLAKLKPPIKSPIRERAMQLAVEWKGRMQVGSEHHLEAVGFLQLVATYGLRFRFKEEELVKLFETAAQHAQAPALCLSLGLTDKISGIIQKLVEIEQPFEALRLIYAFNLVSMFPPIPILKTHLSLNCNAARKILEEGGPSIHAQIKAIDLKVAAMLTVLKCVNKYNLESGYSVKNLRQQVLLLSKKKREFQSQLLGETENREFAFLMAPRTSKESDFALSPTASVTSPDSDLSSSIAFDAFCAQNTDPNSSHTPIMEIPLSILSQPHLPLQI